MASISEFEQQQFGVDDEFTIRTYENGTWLYGNKKWWKQLEELDKFRNQQDLNLIFGTNGK